MSEQEEKAARVEAEARLASARQAQQHSLPYSLHGRDDDLNGVCRAVEADLLLAREGLEQLCQAVQGT